MKTNHLKMMQKKALIETLGHSQYDVYHNSCKDYVLIQHNVERTARFFRDGAERILFRDMPVLMHQMYKLDYANYKKISGDTEYDEHFKPACFRSIHKYIKTLQKCYDPLISVRLVKKKNSLNMEICTKMLTKNEYNIVFLRLSQFLNFNVLTKNNYSFVKTDPELIVVKLQTS